MMWREVEIVPYRDGPYLVRGPFSLKDQDGAPIDASRRTIALCRCGKSRTRPFCDGTHRLIKFQAPSAAEPYTEKVAPVSRHAAVPFASSGRAAATTNGNGSGPELARPTGPSASRTARAAQELRRAHDTLRSAVELRRTGGHVGLRTAGPLVAAARTVMDELATGATRAQADPSVSEELTACRFLVQGALDMLAIVPGDASGEVRRLISQLRAVVGYITPKGHHDDDD